jgi:peptidase S41-like protein
VSSIDGMPAAERLAATMRLASGTTQWREVQALQEIVTCPAGAVVDLGVNDGTGPRTSPLRCDARLPPAEQRPEPVAELRPGVWYVDVTRARMAQIKPVLQKLASATGVIFDVRGYPTDAGAQILPHLLDVTESDRWMHVAKITGPFGQSAGWHSIGWNLKPSTPHVSGKVVFLTDGRAISYAESVMGYVADRKLGTIVGSTTAGANGNVAVFTVPGGFSISFTGMRVTGHDGRTPHHLAGIKPDVPVVPTIAGLRAGRDEVLERGVALVR